ncbi:unnamed protein product [Vitrella brassicaformis CCMP3155]|uniref:PUM-HD domain-containing protein n=3 Tax=Vitrella brassicaformis TaxID=1169539 RepID=A0A0G4EFJ9_VITBC|nr:unnamed protein product [Vitrella brassicaformis CCMP3155]|eukprot:CEL94202.1 unnamed protein product [Vitrella brassicaformis CCMP3155]
MSEEEHPQGMESPPRPASAPPPNHHHEDVLSAENIFAFPPQEFADIRCDDQYNEFYQHFAAKNPNLPPPIEGEPKLAEFAQRKLSKLSEEGASQMDFFSPKMQRLTQSVLKQLETPSFEATLDPAEDSTMEENHLPPAYEEPSDGGNFVLRIQEQPSGPSSSLADLTDTFLGPSSSAGLSSSSSRPLSLMSSVPYPIPPATLQPPSPAVGNQSESLFQSNVFMPPPSTGATQDSSLTMPPPSESTILGAATSMAAHITAQKQQMDGQQGVPGIGVVDGGGQNVHITLSQQFQGLGGLHEGGGRSNGIGERGVGGAGGGGNRKRSPRRRITGPSPIPGAPPGLTIEELVASGLLKGHVYLIAKDQSGCRMLQKKLDESPTVFNGIFEEILENIVELMTDPFGNYLCQKLMEVCSQSQLTMIIDAVAADLVKISLNMHGTRAVQKLIEVLHSPDQISKVIAALRSSVVTLVKDLNGNHVIQKSLQALGPGDNYYIYNAIIGHCYDVATHRHGCCVLQRCIDAARGVQRQRIVDEIIQHAVDLVQDAFGNYVIQYVLNQREPAWNNAIIVKLLGSLVRLSKQKFSSNVVEKCLILGSDEHKRQMVEELLCAGNECLKDLLLDSFANYVIQRALSVAEEPYFSRLIDGIRPHLDALRNSHTGGKRIAAKLMKKYPQLTMGYLGPGGMGGPPPGAPGPAGRGGMMNPQDPQGGPYKGGGHMGGGMWGGHGMPPGARGRGGRDRIGQQVRGPGKGGGPPIDPFGDFQALQSVLNTLAAQQGQTPSAAGGGGMGIDGALVDALGYGNPSGAVDPLALNGMLLNQVDQAIMGQPNLLGQSVGAADLQLLQSLISDPTATQQQQQQQQQQPIGMPTSYGGGSGGGYFSHQPTSPIHGGGANPFGPPQPPQSSSLYSGGGMPYGYGGQGGGSPNVMHPTF